MEKAINQLKKCKDLLKDFENNYPDQDISNLHEKIKEIETKYAHLINQKKDWDLIQKNYNKYCESFSQAYLSGSEWYNYISQFKDNINNHGNFKQAYYYSKYKEQYSDAITFTSMLLFC